MTNGQLCQLSLLNSSFLRAACKRCRSALGIAHTDALSNDLLLIKHLIIEEDRLLYQSMRQTIEGTIFVRDKELILPIGMNMYSRIFSYTRHYAKYEMYYTVAAERRSMFEIRFT